jgi:CelD/BcsL family acetyltransferase involved in cellulose biosynthesis
LTSLKTNQIFGTQALSDAMPLVGPADASPLAAVERLSVQSLWGTVEVLDRLADEWRELCQEGACNQPFLRPEWISASIRAFGHDRRVLVVTVRESGRLRGVLPLWQEETKLLGRRVTKLSSPGSPDHSPRFDFIHGRGTDVAEVVKAAWDHLKKLPDWDVIECRNVPQGGAIELLLRDAHDDQFLTYEYQWAENPYIALPARQSRTDFYQFIRSRRFRHRLRLSRRRLLDKGEISLRRVEAADPQIIQQFYRLERSGWKGQKGTAIDCKPQTRQFYDSIAKDASRFGYLSLYFLEQNGAPIAAHFALTCGERYYPLKVAYDENYGKYGPGHLIIAAVLEDCVARGLKEFDCLGHQTEAKSKWTSQTRPHKFCYIFRNGIAGRVHYAERYLAQKAQLSLRRLRSMLRHSSNSRLASEVAAS